jgi:hypothetical protein
MDEQTRRLLRVEGGILALSGAMQAMAQLEMLNNEPLALLLEKIRKGFVAHAAPNEHDAILIAGGVDVLDRILSKGTPPGSSPTLTLIDGGKRDDDPPSS